MNSLYGFLFIFFSLLSMPICGNSSETDKRDFDSLFTLKHCPDLLSASPSLEEIRDLAVARETLYEQLFQHVVEHGIDETLSDYFDYAVSKENYVRQWDNLVPITPAIINLRSLTRFCIERDIIFYCAETLRRFAENIPTVSQLHTLYDESAQVVRQSLGSIARECYLHLSMKHRDAFPYQNKQYLYKNEVIGMANLDEEEKLYLKFMRNYGNNIANFDTIEIYKAINTLLKKRHLIQNKLIITNLTSIFHYYNIERAFFNACPDIQYDSSKYINQNLFVVRKIKQNYDSSIMYRIGKSEEWNAKVINKYIPGSTFYQSKLNMLIDKKNLHERVNEYLKNIFPEESEVRSAEEVRDEWLEDAINTSKNKNHNKGKKNKNHKKKKKKEKTTNNKFGKSNVDASAGKKGKESVLTEVSQVFETESSQVLKFNEEFVEEIEDFVDDAQPMVVLEDQVISNDVGYRAPYNFYDYVSKRFITKHQSSDYVFNNIKYTFPVITPFNIKDIFEIKKKIGHCPNKPDDLPNLASFVIRFHLVDENNVGSVFDFSTKKNYLSGGWYIKNKSRLDQYALKFMGNTLLTYDEYLRNKKNNVPVNEIALEQLKTVVTDGLWDYNALDSEAHIVLDLHQQIPSILHFLVNQGTSQKIIGVVLQIHSFNDACWRCRNLLQGWQWNLKDRLLHTINSDSFDGISVDEDLATLVQVVGDRRLERECFYFMENYQEVIAMKAGQHNLTLNQTQ